MIDDGEGDIFDKLCEYTPEQIKEQEAYRKQLIADGKLKPDPEEGWTAFLANEKKEQNQKRKEKRQFKNVGLIPYDGWIPGVDRNSKMMFPPRPIMYQGVSIAEGDYYIRKVGHYNDFVKPEEYFLHIKKTVLKNMKK